MFKYRFCFGLYSAELDRNRLLICRRRPFCTEIFVPISEIAAVSVTQITPEKIRVMRVFTSGKGVWLPLAPKKLASDIFELLANEEPTL